jgi:hypothetical protein
MPFAEPRPHRRPFWAQAGGDLVVAPSNPRYQLAITSFTASNQDSEPHFVRFGSRGRAGETQILEALVPGETTMHLPFPHPIVLGAADSFFAEDERPDGALFPMTVVGYEWLATDDETTIIRRVFPWLFVPVRADTPR